MNITVNRNPVTSQQNEIKKTSRKASVFDKQFGIWGKVNAINSNDNTVDVILDTGVYLNNVPVASREWVIYGEDVKKDFNAGERDLPPIQARVFVFMPTFTFNDCFIAPFSGFNNFDKNISSPFLEDDKQNIKERITPSGWHITNDYITGSHKAVSLDKETSLEIDYGTEDKAKEKPELHLKIFDEILIDHTKGGSCTVKIFDSELIIKPGEIYIKPKELAIEVDGNVMLKTNGSTKIESSGDTEVKGKNVTVNATESLLLNTGDAAAFCPNIMPNCPLGPVHGGKAAGIIKLRGA